MSDFRLETGRLLLREMTQADYPALAAILRDPVFETDPAEAAAFDRRFPPRTAHAGLPSQRRFELLASMKRPRP